MATMISTIPPRDPTVIGAVGVTVTLEVGDNVVDEGSVEIEKIMKCYTVYSG